MNSLTRHPFLNYTSPYSGGQGGGGGGGSGTVASSLVGQVPAYTGATTVTGLSWMTVTGTTLTVAGTVAATTLTGDASGVTGIVNAGIASGAAIVDTKLATISTAGKVSNSATTATAAATASTIALRDSSGRGAFVGLILNGVTYVFPGSDGSANQVLQTNGSGTLSWATVSGGSGLPTTGGTMTGAILFSSDNTIDIGANGATRARTGYFGTSVIAPLLNNTGSTITLRGVTYTLPSADGSANQVLQTNGSATLSWATVAGGSGLPTTGGTMTGAILFSADNTIDVGAVGATRPRTVYAGTSVVAPAFTGTLTGNSSGTHTGAVVGNADTATTLATARTINGTSFNGSANITVTAAAGTLTGATLASGVTASSLTSLGTQAANLIFTDATYDIGASGATRPRTGYFSTSVIAPLLNNSGSTITLRGVTYTLPSADGAANTLLSTNGSTVLSWVAAAPTPNSGLMNFGGLLTPDTSGNAAWVESSSNNSNALCPTTQVLRLKNAGSAAIYSYTDGVVIPANFDGTTTVKVNITWRTTATSGNVVLLAKYRSIADAESNDPSTFQESLTATVAAPGTARLLKVSSITMTAANLAAADTMLWAIGRDKSSGSDTLAADIEIVAVTMSY